MDLVGEYHKGEIDGKPCFVYQKVIKPIPQIHSSNSSSIDSSLPVQHLFLCPKFRIGATIDLLKEKGIPYSRVSLVSEILLKFKMSPLFDGKLGHHVLPLFWCNNKETDPESEECCACSIESIGTDYYFCVECDERFHKGCVESPLEINHPSHLKHSLQLYFSKYRSDHCLYCRKNADYMVYYCSLCESYMHMLCAQVTIPFFIDQPKRHDHTLTLFPRQASLTCNVCGLVDRRHLTYVCRSICDFVAHSDCINIPQTIRISRHPHRVSFTSSLPLGKWSCGVCRHEIDCDYGAYTCNIVSSGYAVHTRCALRPDIWDGSELEGVPEDDEEVEPFKRISDGTILHFSHGHHLIYEISGVYDENKFCQACVLPIYKDNFYECVECNFILHESCANAPRKMFHPLHPHPLKLEAVNVEYISVCHACTCLTNSFVYKCSDKGCGEYTLDVRCALVTEPFEYQGHQHPLFLALDPKEKPLCHICKSTNDHMKVLNCIECDFIICFKCATLPYMARYKHDKHYLTFCHGDEASDTDWCELCEGKLVIGGKEGFYKCNDCCTTLHIDCLLGIEPYFKSGHTTKFVGGLEICFLRNNSPSRPICFLCNSRCQYPVFLVYEGRPQRICSYRCIENM